MKLIELVENLKTFEGANAFIEKKLPCVEFDCVDIYLVGSLGISSEVCLFNAEEISNTLTLAIGDTNYVNLFPLYIALEMVQEYIAAHNGKLSNEEIANRLLEYRLKDA